MDHLNETGPANPRKFRILVVDDHPVVRSGLIRLLNQQGHLLCCGEASTAAEAQTCIAALHPDLVVLDLRLKDADGLELIKSLKCQFSGLRILVLSRYEAALYAERALRAGALGYVCKDQAADEIFEAIDTVLGGEVYLSRGLAAQMLHKFLEGAHPSTRLGLEHLTDRELHVLSLLGTGMSTRAVAAKLNLSFKTIETHRENIKLKLGLRNAAELIHYATEWAREPLSVSPPKIGAAKRLDA
jgi:DNA-binding NarL/FixJ family response regulator